MRVASVNVGIVEEIGDGVRSGIGKRPVSGPVRVRAGGLDGDSQADERFHGGADQAVYTYLSEDYAWWSAELGRSLSPGLFGENLTVEGCPAGFSIGDRLLIGRVLLEVTGPRIPCAKLSTIMGDRDFAAAFRLAERCGAYLRVLSDGHIEAGDAVSLIPAPSPVVTVHDVFRLYYDKKAPASAMDAALAVPLAARLRDKFAARRAASA